MSALPKHKRWAMPEWMEPYRKHIVGVSDDRIEEIMNTDGNTANVFNNAPLALICVDVKGQVDMLERLWRFGLLPEGQFDERQCSRCGRAVGKRFYVGTGMVEGRMRGLYLCPLHLNEEG